MAKKKTTKRATTVAAKAAPGKAAKTPKVSGRKPEKKAAKRTSKKTTGKTRAKKKERMKMTDVALLPAANQPQVLIPQNSRDSLTAWLSLYMKIDGEACAEQTRIAKTQDLERFLDYYSTVVGSDSKKLWTRSISEGFQKHLKKQRSERTGRKLAPSTINRV